MQEKKHPVYSSLSLLCFNLFIVSLILVASSYFSLLVLDIIANPDLIFGGGMLLGFLALIFWEKSKDRWGINPNKIKEKQIKKSDNNLFFRTVPYLFLFMLLVIVLNQFFKFDFVTVQITRITILAITFGAITFWRNRERVEKEIEDEKLTEEKAEEKRAKEFDSKFKRLRWFNFSYGVVSNWKDNRDDENQPHHWIYYLEKASKRLKDLGHVTTNL
jgi:hypothetical protein